MSRTTASQNTLPPGLANPNRRTVHLTGLKERMTFTKYSAETDGSYTEFESTVAPGHFNAEHYMPNAKAVLTSQKGIVSGTLDGKKFELKAGDNLTINVGHRYSVKNETSEDAEMTVRMEPGVEGFEKAMYVMHGLAGDGKCGKDGLPSNFVHLAIVVGMMDVILTGWSFWLATPLMALARQYGWATGVEAELLKKYWKA